MKTLQSFLSSLSQEKLRRYLIDAVHEATIHNRYHYNEQNGLDQIKQGNEAIHRLTGFLRLAFDNPNELEELALDGIVEACAIFTPAQRERLRSKFERF